MAIQRAFPSDPDVVIYTSTNSLQMWGDLLKDADKIQLLKMVSRMESGTASVLVSKLSALMLLSCNR